MLFYYPIENQIWLAITVEVLNPPIILSKEKVQSSVNLPSEVWVGVGLYIYVNELIVSILSSFSQLQKIYRFGFQSISLVLNLHLKICASQSIHLELELIIPQIVE